MKNFQNNNGILSNPRKLFLIDVGSLLRSYGASGILKHWNLRYPDIVIQSLRRSWNFTRRREIIS